MKTNLFFDEQPIFANRTLAKKLGLNAAIFLQQINYWIQINKKKGINFVEGRYWTYNSIRAWHENNFDFVSLETVKRTFKRLEDEGYLIVGRFNKNYRDNTKWYAINEEKIEALFAEIEEENDKKAKERLENPEDLEECKFLMGSQIYEIRKATTDDYSVKRKEFLQRCGNSPLDQNDPDPRVKMIEPRVKMTHRIYNRDLPVVVNTNTTSYSKPQNESYPQFDLPKIEEKAQQLQQTKTQCETSPVVLKDTDILLAILNYLIQGLQTLSLAPFLLANVSYISMTAIFSVCEAISNKRENQEMIVDFAAYVTAALIEQIQFAQRNQRLE